MLTVHWQDQHLAVQRLVVRGGQEGSFDREIARIAGEYRLAVADDSVSPEPGDFWIGAHPRTGWQAEDAERVGWASIIETPLALQVLRFAARRQFRATRHDFDWQPSFIVQAA